MTQSARFGFLSPALLAWMFPSLAAQQGPLPPVDPAVRTAVAAALDGQLAADRLSAAAPATRLQLLLPGIEQAAAALPGGSRAAARLRDGLDAARAHGPASRALDRLRDQLGDLIDDLQFAPVKQADMPRDFPLYAAVDEIELRDYPAYRMARTAMRGSGAMGSFWPLFRHIEERGIAMTTPVQMDWQASPSTERSRATSMAFLYGEPTTGSPGQEGVVEVIDVPAVTVLSIGARGSDTSNRVRELRAELEGWLQAHPEWQPCGPLRTMGYNSPMVLGDRRYFEVQLPVRKAGRRIMV